MLADYRLLKASTGLSADPMLDLFEQFCARAAPAMNTMEWSWKFSGWDAAANRVFWLGSSSHRDVTRRALTWLARALGLPRDRSDADWLGLIDTHMDRALVAYAGTNPFTRRPPVIKIYLTLTRCTDALYARHVRPLAPMLPVYCPSGGVTLLCRTIEPGQASSARVYALFDQREARRPRTARFLKRIAGAHGLAAALQYPRVGVGIKADGTDMLGIGLRPTGRRNLDPAYCMSPVMLPLVNAAVRTPVLSERLNDVTWVTVPLDRQSLAFPRQLREMNVYARLRH